MNKTLAWHFVGNTLRDGSKIPKDGVTLKFDGELIMCQSGFHASKRLIDALQYAPGNTICRVEVKNYQEQDDKIVGSERTILWRVDGDEVLKRFARFCALDVVHLWDAPEIVVQYLKTGDESIRIKARDAAEDARVAAGDAAWGAARAARVAARAARVAARVAARGAGAAWVAAGDAAWGAGDAAWGARGALRTKQNRRLTSMVNREHKNV